MSQNSLGGAADLRADESEIVAEKKQAARKKYRTLTLLVSAVLVMAICCLLLSQCGKDNDVDPSSTETKQPVGTTQGLPLQAEWSDWADSIPSYVNDESYIVEEQVLYRSRTLEKTSSTTQNSMEGWELYDTIQGSGDFGDWSDWSSTVVTATDTREVETQTRYRYRDKETTTGSSSSMNGWELYNTTYSWGNYGSWSNWSTSSASNSDSRKVETKTQYRYRNISYSTEYTGWSSWSAWSFDRQSTSDLKKEDSRNVWGYYYYTCPNCGAHMHGWNMYCPSWAGGCGKGWIA